MKGRFRAVMIPVLLILCGGTQELHSRPETETAAEEPKTSRIAGRVLDAETGRALPRVNALVAGTRLGAVTDSAGYYAIDEVPVGQYSVQFRLTGYASVISGDIVVRSGRTTLVSAEMRPQTIELEGVTIQGSYFPQTREEPVSTVNFSFEEIRRASGAAGDVSRIVSVLPSIAKVNDMINGLIVRGGNPIENSFYLDNIEIPNINHFPMKGSSAGPIGLINVDFIRDVNFSAGGFSAAYGDRLSSVMELTFREGNREEFDGQLDMNLAGIGLAGEGPLAGGNGSWLFSARKSYLDLLVNSIGTGVAPRYSDYQGKMVYDLSANSQVALIGLAGLDHISFDKETAVEDGDDNYGTADNLEHMLGLNWNWKPGEAWRMETSVSNMFTRYEDDFSRVRDDSLLYNDRSSERSLALRNVTHYRIDSRRRLKFGLEARHVSNRYQTYAKSYYDLYGNLVPGLTVDRRLSAARLGAFGTYIWSPVPRLELNPGIRLDYFSFNDNTHVSPRMSFTLKLSERNSITGAAGIYRQNLPLSILSASPRLKDLDDPLAYHYILGFNRLLSENTRLSIEVYNKEYHRFPLDAWMPAVFPADEGGNHESLVNGGRAFSRGIEVVLQKKVARDFFGLVSGSIYTSRYRGYDEVWRDRVYGNRFLFNLEGGYIASRKWQYSARWLMAGGRPYTPFDLAVSTALNSGVFDLQRINGERLPTYHSLNFRIDRRFNFQQSNLLIYLDVWNVYNRKNIAAYYWNETENRRDRWDQWSILPVFGLEWEM